MQRSRLTVLAATALTAAIGAGAVYGTTRVQSTTITGCVNTSTKLIRIVKQSSDCILTKETVLTWNQVGSAGSQGPTGPSGPTGAPGATGAQEWVAHASSSPPDTSFLAFSGDGSSAATSATAKPPTFGAAGDYAIGPMVASGHVTHVMGDVTTAPGNGLQPLTIFYIVDLSGGVLLAACVVANAATHCSDSSTGGAFPAGDYLAVAMGVSGSAPGAVQVEFTTGP